MLRIKSSNFFITLLIPAIIGFAVGAICWTGLLNELLMISHRPPIVQWWQGGLIGMIPMMGWIGLFGYVGSWMIKLFVGPQ